MDNLTNNKSKFFREEIKFFIIIIAFVASALFNWFSTKSDISLIKYRVDKIEQARAEVWLKQEAINTEQIKILNDIQMSLAGIKEIIKKNKL